MVSIKSILIRAVHAVELITQRFIEQMMTLIPCPSCQQEVPQHILLFGDHVTDEFGVLSEYTRFGICPSCIKALEAIRFEREQLLLRNERIIHEIEVVKRHNNRAYSQGQKASLKLNDWIQTLDSFEWMCAYSCGQPYEELEHWIPLAGGGGTTADNCVPACFRCNRQKGAKLPSTIGESSLSPSAHRQISQHLSTLYGKDSVPFGTDV